MKTSFLRLPILVLLIAGCTGPLPGEYPKPVSFESMLAISDMASLMRTDWPPALHHLWVVPGDQSKLLDAALRRVGYAIDSEEKPASTSVDFSFHRFGDLDWWEATLTVNKDWRLTRFYESSQGRLVPVSGFTLGGGRSLKGPVSQGKRAHRAATDSSVEQDADGTHGRWFVEVMRTADEKALDFASVIMQGLGMATSSRPTADSAEQVLQVGPFTHLRAAQNALENVRSAGFSGASLLAVREPSMPPPAQKTSDLSTQPTCGPVVLERGSLRANIERLVEECGYSMGRWPDEEGSRTVDWIVRKAHTVTTEASVQGLLNLLRDTYGIESDLRQQTKTIHFREIGDE